MLNTQICINKSTKSINLDIMHSGTFPPDHIISHSEHNKLASLDMTSEAKMVSLASITTVQHPQESKASLLHILF